MRKPKYWEPPFIQVPVAELQRVVWEVINDVLLGGSAPKGGSSTVVDNAATVSLLRQIKDMLMSLSPQVQSLVDQIAASKSIEASSAAAMVQLVSQSKANSDKITTLMAQVAAGSALSAEDAAAIAKGAADLHDSATALQAAVPASVPPPAEPVPVIPPASPAV